MKLQTKKFIQVLVAIAAFSLVAGNITVANAAAKKTITCYKGTVVKKVTAAKPKCPTGYSTKKPAAKPAATTATKAGSVAFAGTYKGKISILFGDGNLIQVTKVDGTGTGNVSGLSAMSGSASSAPANLCDNFDGKGVISGGGNTLNLTFDSSSQGCADSDSAPATITIKGSAKVTGGTGKFAGASGTLTVKGTFDINSKGIVNTSESTSFVLDLSGNITTK
ncbi:unannotated protein [freshwater metagenome]|uniref:Unannotated protein n=1 Tax=freshwater metagenome TaxID=449393 RepID=A0A6J7N085_9ZZZZ|nr:hypothetical protein [Actinomycetota bacterium]MSX45542.1 hypothetical protein [Actinomycetota bacterium]MSX73738.1 hypothetical protein [Actinomycetota bacterium]MSZ01177.1 hypothetical protein [Actinomycetota bacterium]MTA60505.1 hypothetical protein [Actinomycetota bacterium]